MDFPISDAMPGILQDPDGWDTGLGRLYELMASDFVYADPMNLMMMPDNHDRSRIFSVLKEDVDLRKTHMVFTTTTRGYPQIFYGTEVLMKSPVVRDDGVLRGDFPGAGRVTRLTHSPGLSAERKDAQQTLRKLLNWRKTHSAVTSGKLTHYIPEGCTYVYFRHDAAKVAMVVINKCKVDDGVVTGPVCRCPARAVPGGQCADRSTVQFGQDAVAQGQAVGRAGSAALNPVSDSSLAGRSDG